MLEVRLLGSFEVRYQNRVVDIASRPAQSLFAYLILNTGIAHRRERLAGLLWPDSLEGSARDYLRHALWRIRKALQLHASVHYLQADDLTIAFGGAPDYWLDAAELQNVGERASADELISVLSTYKGELLPGFYDEWVTSEREHLNSVYEHHMARLISLLQDGKRWPEILDWGERWIQFGQKPEAAYRALMAAHAANGDMSKVATTYERCMKALRELGMEPSEQTRVMYEELRAGAAALEMERNIPAKEKHSGFPETNLPVPLTSFIGRKRELEKVMKLLGKNRLVTLTGAGGVGKTRLAIEASSRLLHRFKDGVWWVDLVSLNDPSLVPQAVAQVLKVHAVPNVPLIDMLEQAMSSWQALLVLDNCEHLIAACAQFADTLLQACASVKILTTSREILGLSGEATWRVPSLSLPAHVQTSRQQDLENCESVQLFIERARAVRADFKATEQNALPILQICRKLDGIPLAIELASARVKMMPVEELNARLEDRFNILTQGSRTAPARHQTLRATIDWSHSLLVEQERIFLRRLSVFAGGWTLEAAESVAADRGIGAGQALDLLSRLVDKSLVIFEGEGAARYRMLETIREYAREKLLEAGESERLSELHCDYFLRFAEDAEPHLESFWDRQWMVRVERDYDNLRSALTWASRNKPIGALKMVSALAFFWIVRGHEAEGQRWASDALDRVESLAVTDAEANLEQMATRARALFALARLTFSRGDHIHANVYSEMAAQLARQLEDSSFLSTVLSYEVLGRLFLADVAGSEELAAESLAAAHSAGDQAAIGLAQSVSGQVIALLKHDIGRGREVAEQGASLLKKGVTPWIAALTMLSSAMTAKYLGSYSDARQRYLDCLPMFREIDDRHRINIIFSELAHIERYEGRYQEAALMYRRTILEWQAIDHRGAVANQLECLAFIARARGQTDRAARLLGAAQALREESGMPMSAVEQIEYDREVSDLQAEMEEKAMADVWSDGRTMSVEQAVEFALSKQGKAANQQ